MRREVLIIGGDSDEALSRALDASGYACERVETVREALKIADCGRFGLAVLDVGALGARAAEIFPLLRAKGSFPVLVLTPEGGRDALVELLNAGAEDYLTRPFELRELIERIEIQFERSKSDRPRGALSHRDLVLNPATFDVALGGKSVPLTKQEFKILELMLLSPPGRVFTKQDFYDYAWDSGYMGVDKTINVHICNIRRKLRKVTEEPYIETVWGLGFRLI